MSVILQTSSLTKKLGNQTAVDSVNLSVPKGAVYGFLGPNGAGKTTTIRMILGLLRPTSGEVRIFDKKMSKDRAGILRRVGALVESPSFYPHLTGRENVKIVQTLKGVPASEISEVLQLVRLQDAADRKVKGYSLGMKQRLGIATAMLGQPELLLLDEPTNGLDPAGIQEIRHVIRQLAREKGITILVSSHLLSEIEQVASHIGILQNGRLLFQDRLESLQAKAHETVHFRVNQVEQASQALRTAGFLSHTEAGEILLPYEGDQVIARATKILVQTGVDVYGIGHTKSTLEDLFMNLTAQKEHVS